ncbi:MAG: hypothetical protein LBS97_06410 [Treponema sp.]|jgi:hypothetical protein|nr:hypothetical protein [Treponema sp.]
MKARIGTFAAIAAAALLVGAVMVSCVSLKAADAEEIGGEVVAKIEAEDGDLHTYGNGGDEPAVFTNSFIASGAGYVKNIGYSQGYVEVTVPAGVEAGAYGVTLAWSGSESGEVSVTVNADGGSPVTKTVDYYRDGHEWEMEDPQYLQVFTPATGLTLKGGDKLRIQNASDGNWIHIDTIYLFK